MEEIRRMHATPSPLLKQKIKVKKAYGYKVRVAFVASKRWREAADSQVSKLLAETSEAL